jgi:hypothetical protein
MFSEMSMLMSATAALRASRSAVVRRVSRPSSIAGLLYPVKFSGPGVNAFFSVMYGSASSPTRQHWTS